MIDIKKLDKYMIILQIIVTTVIIICLYRIQTKANNMYKSEDKKEETTQVSPQVFPSYDREDRPRKLPETPEEKLQHMRMIGKAMGEECRIIDSSNPMLFQGKIYTNKIELINDMQNSFYFLNQEIIRH